MNVRQNDFLHQEIPAQDLLVFSAFGKLIPFYGSGSNSPVPIAAYSAVDRLGSASKKPLRLSSFTLTSLPFASSRPLRI
jgi:hypothetical protein